MSRPMPDNPFLQGNHTPLNMESDAYDLVVEGEVPRELAGAYFRNGPNPQYPPRVNYHLFDGDGMVHGFFFDDGRVSYKNRWVRTERFTLEREAGEALFGGMSDPSVDPRVQGRSSNTANTNIVWHGGKLLALWEAGLPTELDPVTLETIGPWSFGGKLRKPDDASAAAFEGADPGIMTAHPKLDPETGEMLFFGYDIVPPYLMFHVVDAEGRLVRSEVIDVPFATMMHDFIATRDHVIFPVFPAIIDLEWAMAGEPIMQWRPERGAHIGIMPREGGNADVRWFEMDPCFVFHPSNAHTDGSRIVAEVAQFPDCPLIPGPDGSSNPTLHRWTFDLDSGDVKTEQLDDAVTDFPRLDDRNAGLDNRYSFGPAGLEPGATPLRFDSIVRYDVKSGRRIDHRLRRGSIAGEAVFVPRSSGATEGEGFLLALVNREAEKESDLLILDAENLEAEPLAVVRCPTRVPSGFHGNWQPAS